jgi:hypothetical protein
LDLPARLEPFFFFFDIGMTAFCANVWDRSINVLYLSSSLVFCDRFLNFKCISDGIEIYTGQLKSILDINNPIVLRLFWARLGKVRFCYMLGFKKYFNVLSPFSSLIFCDRFLNVKYASNDILTRCVCVYLI